jgi:hypothetical protein
MQNMFPALRASIGVCLFLAFVAGDAHGGEPISSPTGVPLGSCCNLCPCGYAWAEGLLVTRDNGSADQPLVIDLNTDDELLTTDDLDFDWSGGVRAGYGERICGCLSWEIGYLGVFDQSASQVVELEDSLTLPDDFGLQVNNFFAADEVTVRYESDLHSAEVNLVCCCCQCDGCGRCSSLEWLTGFRYISFDEEFSLRAFDSDEGTTTYAVRTRNDLYGAQLGARARQCVGRWSWETTGKAGIYGNDMGQLQSSIIDFPDVEYRPAQGSRGGDVAFVSDFNISGIYRLNQCWGLRAGYNLIWIEGVALAPDQIDFTNVTGSGTRLVDGGGLLLHGANVGLEARW